MNITPSDDLNGDDYERLMFLLATSPYHSSYTDDDIEDLIDTPIRLKKYILMDDSRGKVVFFATFAHPEEKHVQEYVRTGRFPSEGFYAEGEDIWCIDFICMGGKADVLLSFRFLKNLLCSYGYDRCFWLRTESMKIGYHAVKE